MNIEIKKWAENYVINGNFQKIYWLGVNGYVIVNEQEKQILLIDPWPSYSEHSLRSSQEISNLADWLVRKANEEQYSLIGVIGTHEHFDHIADLPGLYYVLNRSALGIELPPFFSDRGTYEEIQRRWTILYPNIPIGDVIEFNEFTLNNQALYYDDETQEDREDNNIANYPLKAGTKLNKFNIGNYIVTPYIWDHASTATHLDTLSGVKSGNYQRCTALFLKHNNDPEEKTLFIVGSAGEMSDKRTGGYVKDAKIEIDILIQAVPHKILLGTTYNRKLRELIKYQLKNITAKDKIIATHFEDFVDIATISKANYSGALEKEENFEKMENYAEKLENEEEDQDVPNQKRTDKIYYMHRFLIDYGNVIIEEKEEGYSIYVSDIDQNVFSNPLYMPYNKMKLDKKYLIFKQRFLANPNTKEIHVLDKNPGVSGGVPVFFPESLCQMKKMNFRNKKHFETILEALDEGYDYCAWCFGTGMSIR